MKHLRSHQVGILQVAASLVLLFFAIWIVAVVVQAVLTAHATTTAWLSSIIEWTATVGIPTFVRYWWIALTLPLLNVLVVRGSASEFEQLTAPDLSPPAFLDTNSPEELNRIADLELNLEKYDRGIEAGKNILDRVRFTKSGKVDRRSKNADLAEFYAENSLSLELTREELTLKLALLRKAPASRMEAWIESVARVNMMRMVWPSLLASCASLLVYGLIYYGSNTRTLATVAWSAGTFLIIWIVGRAVAESKAREPADRALQEAQDARSAQGAKAIVVSDIETPERLQLPR